MKQGREVDMDEPVTMEERYSRAITTSHLDAGDGASDLDLVIAAGWQADDLAPLLYRVRVELDAVRGDQRRLQQHRRELLSAIKVSTALVRRDMRHGPSRAEEDLAVLHVRERELYDEEVGAFAKALGQVRSLPAAREAVGRWAEIEANRFVVRDVLPRPERVEALEHLLREDMRHGPSPLSERHGELRVRLHRATVSAVRATSLTPQAVCSIAGAALQAFLDPACRSCGGRGFKGNGATVCRACHGSGRAQEAIGQTEEQREFGRLLLSNMEQLTESVDRCMRKHLRGRNLRG